MPSNKTDAVGWWFNETSDGSGKRRTTYIERSFVWKNRAWNQVWPRATPILLRKTSLTFSGHQGLGMAKLKSKYLRNSYRHSKHLMERYCAHIYILISSQKVVPSDPLSKAQADALTHAEFLRKERKRCMVNYLAQRPRLPLWDVEIPWGSILPCHHKLFLRMCNNIDNIIVIFFFITEVIIVISDIAI